MKASTVLSSIVLTGVLTCACFLGIDASALTPGYKQVDKATIGGVTVTKGADVTSVQVPDDTGTGEPKDILYTDANGKAWKVKKNDKGEVVIEAATPPTTGVSGTPASQGDAMLEELSAFLD